MKVLITGSTGRVGRSLLLSQPSDIEVELLLSPVSRQLPGYPWYRADITNYDKTIMAVTCADPDVVIHLAAFSEVDKCELDPDMAYKINSYGTENIAKSCRECGAKMVLLSTDYVFDGVYGPYSENDVPKPINIYGHSKLEAENAVLKYSVNPLIVRISVPFGKREEGTEHNFISWIIESLQLGNTVRIANDQFTTPAYMEEFSRVLWELIVKETVGVYHYGASDRLSRYEMALNLCQVMEFSEKLVIPVKTADLGFGADRPLESGFITGKVQELLEVPPISFNNALIRITET